MAEPAPSPPRPRVTARALLLGERIDAKALGRSDVISATPLAFSVGSAGFVALYRFGFAVEEKPDVLWDRPDLERLYARVEDEYELKERAGTLKRKLDVIVETARALTDIIDADRATRPETTIVVLIVAEIVLTLCQTFGRGAH